MKRNLINQIVSFWDLSEDDELFPPQFISDELRHLHTLNVKQLRQYLNKEKHS